MEINLKMSDKQKLFCKSKAFETLYGGAAGGGKSYVQLMDAMLYALKYPGSKQLILRRTFPELEKSLIRVSLGMFPQSIYKYNSGKHTGIFSNGSIVDFGYCDSENDVFKYQSAEYDVIRFDELTHFTEYMYVYLLSRVRGANNFPKHVKCSTNPGGVGHSWVKARFIDVAPPLEMYTAENNTTRVFIPARVTDNKPLMESDPEYINRLNALSEKDRKALLDGDWDIFDGQYFSEFNREIHVIKPFSVPKHWKRYIAMDYGLDMLAAYLIAVDEHEKAYVMREVYEPNLIISAAAAKIKAELMSGECVELFYAPPDMWNRRQDSGKSVAEIFYEHGIMLAKSSNDRESGWLNMKEWLKPYTDETGSVTANLLIFDCCTNLVRCLPALTYNEKKPNDVANEPHEITHGPDAIRYFVAGRPQRSFVPQAVDEDILTYDQQISNFINF